LSNEPQNGAARDEPLFPVFLKLSGRKVVLVGGGTVAVAKHGALRAAGAQVTVVAPAIRPELRVVGTTLIERPFSPGDLEGAWFVVAAATPKVNRQVRAAAEARRLFVNAVDDPAVATAYAGGVVRRGPATVAISTGGGAPALAGLLREALEALLPEDVGRWMEVAAAARQQWKRDGVPTDQRRPLLLQALNGIYQTQAAASPTAEQFSLAPARELDANGRGAGVGRTTATPSPARGETRTNKAHGRPLGQGRVSLVGTGPGDPALLTVRAVERLGEADLVLYDALVSPALRALAPEARWFFVGKRAGRESISQEAINRMIVREARRGRDVVRLKGGDPFVLGRGGEEALALAEVGIPCEVVPGVTSAVAGPALAGIPVTHRGLASGFTVVSGHAPAAYAPLLGALPPGSTTLVVLMGLGARADVAARLLGAGWDPATPAAVVLGASLPQAWRWVGRLDELGAVALPPEDAQWLPGLVVVGPVVALARQLVPSMVAQAEIGQEPEIDLAASVFSGALRGPG
jgi:uroporphyrin-III C-methyltransferase / precorrin-2 dehydrogenase / sirohydrochlorin ferrochelatase